MKKIIAILIAVMSGFPMSRILFAGGEGTSSGVFLTLPSAPSMAALGGPGAAAPGGPSVLYDNPAGLAAIKNIASELSHSAWLGGLNYDVFSVAVPFKSGDTVALGVRYMEYGIIDALDNTGNDAGHIVPRDMIVSAGYARAFANGLSAGLAGKYIDSKITMSASAFALDGGVRYRRDKLILGAAIINLGGKLRYAHEAYPLPLTYNLGASYRINPAWTLFSEMDIPRAGLSRAGCGAERSFQFGGDSAFTVRAGYANRYSRTGGVNGLSGGLGLALKTFTFDYAFNAIGELGVAHHFGIGLRWGAPISVAGE